MWNSLLPKKTGKAIAAKNPNTGVSLRSPMVSSCVLPHITRRVGSIHSRGNHKGIAPSGLGVTLTHPIPKQVN
ncbi:hypothetical protein [Allocoleopsis sp.]|uniref:hypothetical protein n=1 Tax=Allocoleopsis sp. TaxID=3088169 RepID=UPI002FD50AF3